MQSENGLRKTFLTLFVACLLILKGFSNNTDILFRTIDKAAGLSNNQVNCFLQDSKGFIWIGTMSGLNRYDGVNIKIFEHDPNDSLSLFDNFVLKIVEDQNGILWILSRNSSLCFYDPVSETFSDQYDLLTKNIAIPRNNISDIFTDSQKNIWVVNDFFGVYVYDNVKDSILWLNHSPHDSSSIISNRVSCIAQNSKGDYWLVNREGVLEKLDKKTLKIVERIKVFDGLIEDRGENFRIFIDSDDDVWVYLESNSLGLTYYNTKQKSQKRYDIHHPKFKINNNTVKGITQDSKGRIWVGTDHGGINLIDKEKVTINSIISIKGGANTLPNNSITTLHTDKSGITWVGMYKNGVAYYHSNFFKFKWETNNPFDPVSLPYDDINCFAEDENGNLWLGTNGKGLIYHNVKDGTYKSYVHDPDNPNGITNDVIICLLYDSKKRLWVGTYFGGLNLYENGRFYHFKHSVKESGTLSNDRVWQIFEDSRNKIWIGTLGGGVDLFDPGSGKFINHKGSDVNSVNSDFIYSIEEDHEGNLWFGTINGVSCLNRTTKRFYLYINQKNSPNSLSNNKVIVVKTDKRGWCWIGTNYGLNLYIPGQNNFRIFSKKEGLADNTILGIESDSLGNLWLSTPAGLSKMIIKNVESVANFNYSILNFDKSDGLKNINFNERSSFEAKSGNLLFGSSNGYIKFKPNEIKDIDHVKSVVLTNFELFNQKVKVNKRINKRVVLEKSISYTPRLNLKHNENIFAIEFTVPDYFHPERLIYQYKLEGFNDEWLDIASNIRKATFTNLNAGRYIFHVRVSKDGINWVTNHDSLEINILPPIWATIWARIAYALLFSLLMVLLWRLIIMQERARNQVENIKRETTRIQEVDQMKFKFFTNISHEFRTPLTLILSPVEKLIAETNNQKQLIHLKIIERNAKRLLNLVNQLLDFRKVEAGQLSLNISYGNIIQFVKDATLSFMHLSKKKEIGLSFETNVDEFNTWFDYDKLERIMFNLLSNAFKFTPTNGKITVSVKIISYLIDETINSEKFVRIEVTDTGTGISSSELDRIFDRFYQEENLSSTNHHGSGIGLSICKEFVKLLGGEIYVRSALNRGSVFTVKIPLRLKGNKHEKTPEESNLPDSVVNIPEDEFFVPDAGTRKKVLLVEDNDDLRLYLKKNLGGNYNVEEAPNGKVAWLRAKESPPDLIISDIMMPEMDGIDLCKQIKANVITSHIPVILLTARHSEENKFEGLKTGADEYITKPFSFDILELKIKNLIHSRAIIHEKISRTFKIEPSEITITSLDEKIFQKALEVVDQNIGNSSFNVEQLAVELGMSRANLYNKFMAITGKTPAEFIKVMRLKRAAQLMEKSQLSVSEISYEVGYNGPRYFSVHFKEQFKMSPSEYMKNKKFF